MFLLRAVLRVSAWRFLTHGEASLWLSTSKRTLLVWEVVWLLTLSKLVCLLLWGWLWGWRRHKGGVRLWIQERIVACDRLLASQEWIALNIHELRCSFNWWLNHRILNYGLLLIHAVEWRVIGDLDDRFYFRLKLCWRQLTHLICIGVICLILSHDVFLDGIHVQWDIGFWHVIWCCLSTKESRCRTGCTTSTKKTTGLRLASLIEKTSLRLVCRLGLICLWQLLSFTE
jgi:hypothetical protein